MSATVTSFKEIPLEELNYQDEFRKLAQNERDQESFDAGDQEPGEKNNLKKNATYGSLNQPEVNHIFFLFVQCWRANMEVDVGILMAGFMIFFFFQ